MKTKKVFMKKLAVVPFLFIMEQAAAMEDKDAFQDRLYSEAMSYHPGGDSEPSIFSSSSSSSESNSCDYDTTDTSSNSDSSNDMYTDDTGHGIYDDE